MSVFSERTQNFAAGPSESTKTTAICLVLVSIYKNDKNCVLTTVQQTVSFQKRLLTEHTLGSKAQKIRTWYYCQKCYECPTATETMLLYACFCILSELFSSHCFFNLAFGICTGLFHIFGWLFFCVHHHHERHSFFLLAILVKISSSWRVLFLDCAG